MDRRDVINMTVARSDASARSSERTAHAHSLWHIFHAKHIATDLSEAFTVERNDRASMARQKLESQRFDQAPVVFQKHLVGWVTTARLPESGSVKGVMQPLEKCAIVSAESSISGVLQLLGQHGLIFTAGELGVSGFIVPSDLDRHAARSHFYILVAGIEMLLSDIVRTSVDPAEIKAVMDTELEKRYEEALTADRETHPVEYLYLQELVDLFLQTDQAKNVDNWDQALSNHLNEINKFRTSVMHPTRSIAARRQPSALAALARSAEEVAARLKQISMMGT